MSVEKSQAKTVAYDSSRFRGLYGIAGPDAAMPPDERLAVTIARARALIAGGAPVIQLRDKDADGRLLVEEARALRSLTREAGVLFVVNDRLDVALISEADGLHVGQEDLPVDMVRAVAARAGRPDLFIGLSTHSLEQVRAGIASGADYLGFGPIYATATKANASPVRGIDLLAEAVREAGSLPIVAIGGLTLERASEVRATGTAMGAVISDVVHAPDPIERARAIHAVLTPP